MNLKEVYKKQIVKALSKKLNLSNSLSAPAMQKVTINVGLNAAQKDENFKETVKNTLFKITGQLPVETKARKSIAGFKVREGMTVGAKVTLRGSRMYDFIEKLISITLPRVRDFRGISPKSVDRQGNMTIGFKEHLPFPEVNPDEVDRLHGLEVVITTSADTKEGGFELFKLLGFPFQQ